MGLDFGLDFGEEKTGDLINIKIHNISASSLGGNKFHPLYPSSEAHTNYRDYSQGGENDLQFNADITLPDGVQLISAIVHGTGINQPWEFYAIDIETGAETLIFNEDVNVGDDTTANSAALTVDNKKYHYAFVVFVDLNERIYGAKVEYVDDYITDYSQN